jgi:hypothetical protein
MGRCSIGPKATLCLTGCRQPSGGVPLPFDRVILASRLGEANGRLCDTVQTSRRWDVFCLAWALQTWHSKCDTPNPVDIEKSEGGEWCGVSTT